MKSINERAEDYVSGFHSSIQRMCKESYIDGANDVLVDIDKMLQGDLNSHSAFKLKTIKQIIEELKK